MQTLHIRRKKNHEENAIKFGYKHPTNNKSHSKMLDNANAISAYR